LNIFVDTCRIFFHSINYRLPHRTTQYKSRIYYTVRTHVYKRDTVTDIRNRMLYALEAVDFI